jgi:plastocyanin
MNSLKLSNRKSFVATVIAISLLITFPLSTLLIREVAAQTTHEVKITDFAFVPQILTINPGDTVMWNNTDPVIHTLWFVYVSNGSTYLLSDPLPPDTMWSYTFNDPVELQYYSFDKLWITGNLTVRTSPLPVGGLMVPVDKFGLVAPYIGLASTILVATVATAIYVKRVKRREEKQ